MRDWADGIETRNYGIKSEMDARAVSEHVRTIISLSLVAGALLFYSWVRSQIISTGYESHKLFTAEETLLGAERKLALEEETLRRPERIDLIARTDLGMKPLRPNQLLPQNEGAERSTANSVAMIVPETADLKKPAARRLVNFSN